MLDLVGVELQVLGDLGRRGLAASWLTSRRSQRVMRLSFSTTWTGMRIVRDWSATARAIAWRIHQVA